MDLQLPRSARCDASTTLVSPRKRPILRNDGPDTPFTLKSDKHWVDVLKLVQKFDQNFCESNKEKLERQYQIALFVTSFVGMILADSYKWLTPNANHSIIAQFCSGTPLVEPQFIATPSAVMINGLWFLTLIIMIASIYMCSISLDWLREFRDWPQLDPKNILAFRQIRYESLRRWRLFEMCNIIPVLLPLASMFWFVGLIWLLWKLNRGIAYVLICAWATLVLHYLVTALHPLCYSLLSRQNTLIWAASPFMSPASWLMFKFGYWCTLTLKSIWIKGQIRARLSPDGWHHTPRNFQSIFARGQRVSKSIDWLDHTCYALLDPQNTAAIDATVARALVWIDENPTIEKTPKVLRSMYQCVKDLPLRTVLRQFEPEWDRPPCDSQPSGLAAALTFSAKFAPCRTNADEEKARALVLKLWLDQYGHRIPQLRTHLAELHVRCMDYFSEGINSAYLGLDSFNVVQQEDLDSSKLIEHILSIARRGLSNNRYVRGTFWVMHLVMDRYEGRSEDREEIRRLLESTFTEGERFVERHQDLVDEIQASSFMRGFEWFKSARAADSRHPLPFLDHAESLKRIVQSCFWMAQGYHPGSRGDGPDATSPA